MLTDYEKQTMTCRDIDLETAKVRGWMDGVNKESEFSARDVWPSLAISESTIRWNAAPPWKAPTIDWPAFAT